MKFIGKLNPNSKAMWEHKASQPPQTSFQKEIQVGTVLGDASLGHQAKDIRVKFQQSDAHREYLDYQISHFEGWVQSPPHKQERKTGLMWGAQTISHHEFNFQRDIFLVKRGDKLVKGINDLKTIEPYIGPVSIAFWFMDDGSKTDYRPNGTKGQDFHTQGFTQEEVDQQISILRSKFNIDCWSVLNKGKPIIRTSSYSYDVIFKMIDKYMTSSMRYKLPLFDDIV